MLLFIKSVLPSGKVLTLSKLIFMSLLFMASSFKLALEWLLDFVQLRGKVRNMPQ
jgi:hypothetical protein